MLTRNLIFAAVFTTLGLSACASDTEDDTHAHVCEEGTFQCDGDMLQECTHDGWEDSQDCAETMQMCHAEGGHCMDMEDEGDDMGDM